MARLVCSEKREKPEKLAREVKLQSVGRMSLSTRVSFGNSKECICYNLLSVSDNTKQR